MIWCLLVTDLTGQALRLRYNAIVESTDDAVMSFDLNGRITSWNRAAEALFGYTAEEAIGRDADLLAPLSGVFGETLAGSKFQKDTRCAGKDGAIIDVSVTASPIRAPDGAITGLSAIMRDVTERKQAEERERLLMQEVNHRAKNMLSLVQSIARQTAAGTPKDFIERFEDRIHALSASQDLLVKSGWRNVPLESLVHAQLGLFADLVGRRIRLSGPELEIAAAAAQAIGMALHELATNAAKYGALSNDTGIVALSWRLGGNGSEPRFVMSWAETGGPPVANPIRRGFGSTVTGSLVKMSLDAEVETDFAAEGLIWRLSCSANKVVESGSPGTAISFRADRP